MASQSLSLSDRVQVGDMFDREASYKRNFSTAMALSELFGKRAVLTKSDLVSITPGFFKTNKVEFQEALPLGVAGFKLHYFGDAAGLVAQALGLSPISLTVFPPDSKSKILGYNPKAKTAYPPEVLAERTDYHRFVEFIGKDKVEAALEFLQEQVYTEYESLDALRQSLKAGIYPQNVDKDIDLEVE